MLNLINKNSFSIKLVYTSFIFVFNKSINDICDLRIFLRQNSKKKKVKLFEQTIYK